MVRFSLAGRCGPIGSSLPGQKPGSSSSPGMSFAANLAKPQEFFLGVLIEVSQTQMTIEELTSSSRCQLEG